MTEPQSAQDGGSAPAEPHTHRIGRSGSSIAWSGAIFGAAVLAALIIFIAQNSTAVHIRFLGLHARIQLGLALLVAGLGGGVVVLVIGGLRIYSLRRAATRHSAEDLATFRRAHRSRQPASPNG
jgi:uncharacterized integral membrane protein